MVKSKKIFNILKKKIFNHNANIAVIGLGYVGLPLVNLIQEKKFNVIGYDLDKKKISLLKKKKNYIPYLKFNFSKRVTFTNNIKDIENVDIVIIAVPTPLKNKQPNLKYLKNFINAFKDNKFAFINYPAQSSKTFSHSGEYGFEMFPEEAKFIFVNAKFAVKGSLGVGDP